MQFLGVEWLQPKYPFETARGASCLRMISYELDMGFVTPTVVLISGTT